MIDDVRKFMDACGQIVDKHDDKQSYLYDSLILEEFKEYLEATGTKDDLETLDACCDMIWVIIGYCISRGWDIQGAFNEVARSNMSKLDPATGKAIKREDGKIMKPANYSPPNLKEFL